MFNGIHAVLMLHPGASPYWEFIPSHAGMRLRAQFSKGQPGIDATAALKLEKTISRTLARMRHAPYFCRVAPEGQQVGARADMFIAAPSLVELIKVVELLPHLTARPGSPRVAADHRPTNHQLDGSPDHEPQADTSAV